MICVAGGANIDICGQVTDTVRLRDSNPGTVSISFGGVGRNIAEVCASLGSDVRFVTVFSDDFFGKNLRESCEKAGIDCSCSLTASHIPSSVYLALLDDRHDMFAAVNDMRILELLDAGTVLQAVKDAGKDDVLVLDGNLREDVLKEVFAAAKCLTAADPVSTAKCGKFLPYLGKIGIFKPNQYEAQQLSGIHIRDKESASEALMWFRERGVREILISLAERGVVMASEEGMYRIAHRKVDVENANGGGDTFTAAYISERASGKAPLAAAEFAVGAALAVVSGNVHRDQVRRDHAEAQIRNMEMEVTRF